MNGLTNFWPILFFKITEGRVFKSCCPWWALMGSSARMRSLSLFTLHPEIPATERSCDSEKVKEESWLQCFCLDIAPRYARFCKVRNDPLIFHQTQARAHNYASFCDAKRNSWRHNTSLLFSPEENNSLFGRWMGCYNPIFFLVPHHTMYGEFW